MPEFTSTWGDPKSPTVVLLPGGGGTQWLWTPHADLLKDEYRVVALDMPAHGVHPDSSFSFDRAIEDIGEVLDEEESAVLVGHSLGGRVAMEAASVHDGRVDGLLVAGVTTSPGLLKSCLYLPLSFVIESAAHVTRIREWMDEQYGLDNERQVPPDSANTHDEAIATARGIRGGVFRDSLSPSEFYDGPTMFTYGKEEVEVTTAEQLADRFDARLRWYEGGHGVPSRDHSMFAGIVSEFVNAVYDENRVVPETE